MHLILKLTDVGLGTTLNGDGVHIPYGKSYLRNEHFVIDEDWASINRCWVTGGVLGTFLSGLNTR